MSAKLVAGEEYCHGTLYKYHRIDIGQIKGIHYIYPMLPIRITSTLKRG